MRVQYVLSTVWGVQYRGVYLEYCGDVQYRGGYNEYRGVFSTMGDIMSTVGDVQYRGKISSFVI